MFPSIIRLSVGSLKRRAGLHLQAAVQVGLFARHQCGTDDAVLAELSLKCGYFKNSCGTLQWEASSSPDPSVTCIAVSFEITGLSLAFRFTILMLDDNYCHLNMMHVIHEQ